MDLLTCGFFKLPREIRDEIYRYLLNSRYTKVEDNPKSAEYDLYRKSYLTGANHGYYFHTAILATNRQIHQEAKEILQWENFFIRFTALNSSYYQTFMIWDFSIIATKANGNAETRFPMCAMNLEMSSSSSPGQQVPHDLGVLDVVFLAADLPMFCTGLLRTVERSRRQGLRDFMMTVWLNDRMMISSGQEIDILPSTKSRLWRLLDPIRCLHSFERVNIIGSGSEEYQAAVIADMTAPKPRATKTIKSILKYQDEAGLAYHARNFTVAITQCKRALGVALGSYDHEDEWREVLEEGPYVHWTFAAAKQHLKAILHAQVAANYLGLRRFRMARIYVERVTHWVWTKDIRGWTEKTPLAIRPTDFWASAYAEVVNVAARISFAHGNLRSMSSELAEAERLHPNNRETQYLRKLLDYKHHIRDTRKMEAAQLQEKQVQEKQRAAFQTMLNRQMAGDEAIAVRHFLKARSKYERALEQLHIVTQMPNTWDLVREGLALVPKACSDTETASIWNDILYNDPLIVHRLQLCAKLTTIAEDLDDYEKTCEWADATTATRPAFYRKYEHRTLWESFAAPEYQQAHMSKSLALEKMGRFREAMTEMERASDLSIGGGCATDKLIKLRLRLKPAMEEEKRKEKLAAKQAKRTVQKITRHGKIRDKKPKREGYIVGAKR